MGRNQLTPFLFTSVISSSATWENGNLKKFEWASTFHSKLKNLGMLQQNLKKFTSISSSTFIFCQGSAKCTKGMVIFSVSLYKITSPRNPTFSQHGPARYFFQNEAKATPKNASFHLPEAEMQQAFAWLINPELCLFRNYSTFFVQTSSSKHKYTTEGQCKLHKQKKKLKSVVSRGSRRETKSF